MTPDELAHEPGDRPGRRMTQVTGSREDPHAQARAARERSLLLHSMSVFRELFETIFAHREIATVVEVGVESGQVSSVYADLGATVHCVEPAPDDELRAVLAADPRLNLVEGLSPAVLGDLPVADLYVLDGDHNYAVVRAELAWIMENAPDAVVVLHDVLWPCGRRDFYYQPSPVAPEDRHPATKDGPTVWHDDVTPAGLIGDGAYTVAQHAGGPRNGVLTAVEDALDGAGGDWRLVIVPAVFGFGVLMRDSAPGAEEIVEALRPLTSSTLLAAMEDNRIALYTRVLQLQYEAEARTDDATRLAETITAQQREIAGLRSELDRARAENATVRQEVRSLREASAPSSAPAPVQEPELGEAVSHLGRALSARIRKNSGRSRPAR
ncbi:class I SAM-dependent methyltransferase [Actinomadura sp. 3N508]|uniref:class I SAM-dependent methyltransferase n=1 Tax=Actinomadura sp. 3N508 TaxID=3375153 RepID=UPI0037ABE3E0